jgi:hypothetical protein
MAYNDTCLIHSALDAVFIVYFSVVFKEPVYSFSEVQLFMWHTLKYLHKVIKTIFE